MKGALLELKTIQIHQTESGSAAPGENPSSPLEAGVRPGANDSEGGKVDSGTCGSSNWGAEIGGKVPANPFACDPKPARSNGLLEGTGPKPKAPIPVPSGSKACPNTGGKYVFVSGVASIVVAGRISIAIIIA